MVNRSDLAPYAQHRPATAGTVLAIIGCIVMGLGVLLWLFVSFSMAIVAFEGRVLAMVLAPLTVPLVLAPFLWAGRIDPRRFKLLAFAFAWGGPGAYLIANVLNTASFAFIGCEETIVAAGPIVEEVGKSLFLFWLLFFRRRELTGVIDGIVYGGVIGAGFAYIENIDYYTMPFLGTTEDICAAVAAPPTSFEQSVSGTLLTFVGRGILTPFTHPVLTTMTGIGIGIAVVSRKRIVRVVAPILGLTLAAAMHGSFNFSVTFLSASALPIVIALAPWSVIIAIVIYVAVRQSRDLAIIRSRLGEFMGRGWITPAEAGALMTVRGRRYARKATTAWFGGPAGRLLHQRQVAVVKLALLEARDPHGRELAAYRYELIQFLNTRRPPPQGFRAIAMTSS